MISLPCAFNQIALVVKSSTIFVITLWRVARHFNQHLASLLEHAMQFTKRYVQFPNVFQHMKNKDQINETVRKAQLCYISEDSSLAVTVAFGEKVHWNMVQPCLGARSLDSCEHARVRAKMKYSFHIPCRFQQVMLCEIEASSTVAFLGQTRRAHRMRTAIEDCEVSMESTAWAEVLQEM